MSEGELSLPRGEIVMMSPQSGTGFPIKQQEWDMLQNKILNLQSKKTFWDSFSWKDLGMVFIGIGLTSVFSFWLPGYTDKHLSTIAMIIMCGSFLLGGLLIFFQHQLIGKDDSNINSKVSSIIEIMDLIHQDYSEQTNENQNE